MENGEDGQREPRSQRVRILVCLRFVTQSWEYGRGEGIRELPLFLYRVRRRLRQIHVLAMVTSRAAFENVDIPLVFLGFVT